MIVGSRMAPAAGGSGAGRGIPLLSVVASTVFHAGIVAAVIYGAFGTAVSPPDPIVVELEADVGTGSTAIGAPADQQGTSAGGSQALADASEISSVGAQDPDKRSPTMTAGQRGPPMSRPRPAARKQGLDAKQLRYPRQQRTVAEPAEPAPAKPPAPVAELTMPVGDALWPSDDRMPSDASLVSSLGLAGAARGADGVGGRPGLGAGDHGSTHGPGFSLGSATNPMPSYPPAARRRGVEGKVVLDVLVSAEGQALAVDIARSSGSAMLDEAARETIRRWRFRPAMRGGKATEARAAVPVQFSLIEP